MHGTARHRVAVWLRIVVSAVLLGVLVTRIDLDGVLPEQRHVSTLAWFVAGVAAMAVGIVLGSWRWKLVLRVFDVDVPVRTLATHSFAGQFVGNVLPSTIGGDVLRVSRATRTTGSGEVAFASVVLERLTGFVALPLLTLVGFALRPSLHESHGWLALVVAGVALVALAVVLLLVGHPRLAGRFAGDERWTRFVGAVHTGLDGLRRHPRQALRVLGAALAFQIANVAAVLCAVHVMDLSVPVVAVLAFAPAVAMVQVLPVSVGGLGVREGTFVLLLAGVGVGTGRAAAVGLVWYAETLVASMLGAPAFAVGAPRRARRRTSR